MPILFHCLHKSWAFLEDITSLAFGWAKCPPLHSPFMLRLSALRVPHRDPHPRLAQPLDQRRSHVSPAYVSLETSHAYQGICSTGSCHWGCRGVSVGHSPLPGAVSWYLAPVCRQLLMPAGELPWPPEGLVMWTPLAGPGLDFWVAGWLVDNGSHTTMVLFQHGGAPHLCKWLISEDKMSWIAILSQGLQGSRLGGLLSRYTSWYRSWVSFWEVW